MKFLTGILAALTAFSAIAHAGEPTLPRKVSRIAFGSCANTSYPNQSVWKTILRDDPDLFLMLGDNIYGDTEDTTTLRDKYHRLDAIPGFATLRQKIPILATWDDHDFGVNDGGSDYPKRVESQKVFLDFFKEPAASPRRRQEGVYDARILGPEGRRVQIILLDTRYFRSPLLRAERGYTPDPDSTKTMLGETQWAWLKEQLRQPAEVRLIVSSIQVAADEDPYEKWANFPRERRRLFDLIRETGASGVILLSGDRHFAELSKIDAQLGYPLYDLTASPLAAVYRRFEPGPNAYRIGLMSTGENYGFVSIDWDRKDPEIRLEVRDLEGDAAFLRKIRLSELRPYAIDRLPLLLWGRPMIGSSMSLR